MQNLNFRVEKIDPDNIPDFKELYLNFKQRAFADYKFELTPLEYDDFLNAIKSGMLTVILLYEDSDAKGFLIFTTEINEAVELNIIHIIDDKNLKERKEALLDTFFEANKKQ